MRTMIVTLALLGTAAPASAQSAGTLEMRCHMLLRGVPSEDPTVFTLDGPDLFSASIGERRRISVSGPGAPLYLSTDRIGGVAMRTFAEHRRAGSIVTRHVFWQPDGKPRRLRFTERYDFAAGTLTMSGERGDMCHANGH